MVTSDQASAPRRGGKLAATWQSFLVALDRLHGSDSSTGLGRISTPSATIHTGNVSSVAFVNLISYGLGGGVNVGVGVVVGVVVVSEVDDALLHVVHDPGQARSAT